MTARDHTKKPPRGPWVPAYMSLMRGKRRAIPRAARFVFLEICLRLREARGERIELRADIDIAEALMEDIGGPLDEVRSAIERLSSEGLIVIASGDGVATIAVPSVATHGLGDDALRKALGRTPDNVRTTSGQHPDNVSAPKRTGSGQRVRPPPDNIRTTSGPRVEESREEEMRERASAPETPTREEPPAVAESDPPEVGDVVAELNRHRDLWRDTPSVAIADVARRCAAAVAREPTAARCGLTASTATEEAIAQARTFAAAHPMASGAQVLAEVERIVVRYILGDCRSGKRRKAPAPGAAPPRTGYHADNEGIDIEYERERRRKNAMWNPHPPRDEAAIHAQWLKDHPDFVPSTGLKP